MRLRTEHVEVDFKLRLKKDLCENEVVCNKCSGTGLQVDDHPFGLANERKDCSNLFPYKKQTIVGCSHCFTGVQRKCELCGELLGRNSQCNCDQYIEKKKKERFDKDVDTWEKAMKISVQELIQSGYENMLYLDNADRYFTDIDELLEFLSYQLSDREIETEDLSSMRIYKTSKSSISFDAQHIIESATENHHEGAYEDVMKYEKDLQDYLDSFANKVKDVATSYFPDYKSGVIISLEDIQSF
ncbi:hypothetical protein SMD22_01175 (plasmid) [Brevibacillus halotolerans]|nr:hypothetical protein SMD22_01175 [Brevibacillus halotolerans]